MKEDQFVRTQLHFGVVSLYFKGNASNCLDYFLYFVKFSNLKHPSSVQYEEEVLVVDSKLDDFAPFDFEDVVLALHVNMHKDQF